MTDDLLSRHNVEILTKRFFNLTATVKPVTANHYTVRIGCIIAYRKGWDGPIDMTTATNAAFELQAEDRRSWARSAVDRLLINEPYEPLGDEWSMLYLALQRLPQHLQRLVLREARRRGRQLRQKLRLGERRWDRPLDHYSNREWADLHRANDRTRSRLFTTGEIVRNTDRYTRHNYFPDRIIDDVPLGHFLLITGPATAAPVKVGEA